MVVVSTQVPYLSSASDSTDICINKGCRVRVSEHRFETMRMYTWHLQIRLRTPRWFLESQPLTVRWSKFIHSSPIHCSDKPLSLAPTLAHDDSGVLDRLLTSPFTQASPSKVVRRGCSGLKLLPRVWLRRRLQTPTPVASDPYFLGLEATGFGFGFLNFQMETAGFGFGLGLLSPLWLRLLLRCHHPAGGIEARLPTQPCSRLKCFPRKSYDPTRDSGSFLKYSFESTQAQAGNHSIWINLWINVDSCPGLAGVGVGYLTLRYAALRCVTLRYLLYKTIR